LPCQIQNWEQAQGAEAHDNMTSIFLPLKDLICTHANDTANFKLLLHWNFKRVWHNTSKIKTFDVFCVHLSCYNVFGRRIIWMAHERIQFNYFSSFIGSTILITEIWSTVIQYCNGSIHKATLREPSRTWWVLSHCQWSIAAVDLPVDSTWHSGCRQCPQCCTLLLDLPCYGLVGCEHCVVRCIYSNVIDKRVVNINHRADKFADTD
jgi:hypothetical protein